MKRQITVSEFQEMIQAAEKVSFKNYEINIQWSEEKSKEFGI